MGYRSNGLWVIKGPVKHIIAAMVKAKLLLPPPLPHTIWEEFDTFRVDGTGFIRLEYEDWKWYPDYPEVVWMDSFWRLLANYPDEGNANPLSGRRIRIGEDHDDVELDEFGNNPPDIDTYVSINDNEPHHGLSLVSEPKETK